MGFVNSRFSRLEAYPQADRGVSPSRSRPQIAFGTTCAYSHVVRSGSMHRSGRWKCLTPYATLSGLNVSGFLTVPERVENFGRHAQAVVVLIEPSQLFKGSVRLTCKG